MPKPPRTTPRLTRARIASKLALVRKGTNLGSHEEPRLQSDGHSILYSHTVTVPDNWAVVYGRVVKVNDSEAVQLIILAQPNQVHRVSIDGVLLPDKQ